MAPPPPEPELSQVLAEYFEAEYLKELGTVHGMLDSQPVIDIHVLDDGYQIVLHTAGAVSLEQHGDRTLG